VDYLVQRYRATTASWEDITIVKDLGADEYEQAAQQAMAQPSVMPPEQPDRLRVIKWDHVEEFAAAPGPPVLSPEAKAPQGLAERGTAPPPPTPPTAGIGSPETRG